MVCSQKDMKQQRYYKKVSLHLFRLQIKVYLYILMLQAQIIILVIPPFFFFADCHDSRALSIIVIV